jgi:predicted nucleic acid binding AN1-type Zn finger protein
MVNRGPVCAFTGCRKKAQPIMGDCSHCSKGYCSSHRLPESHVCVGLQDASDEARALNKAKLESEATKANKGLQAI